MKLSHSLAWCFYLATLFIGSRMPALGQTVSNLTATYRNGQVFLRWTCPKGTNRQYNVYRSTTKFTDVSQLNSSTFVGFVRDSSCKNIRLSEILGGSRYYKIDDNGTTLQKNQGLFVTTCTDNQAYYYAVMVVKLSSNTENKKIRSGKNTLSTPVQEAIAQPAPVFQDSVTWGHGDVVKYYTWFGNNMETAHFPALSSVGSYGFNFYVIRRGQATQYPLFAFYEGLRENSLKGNGLDSFKNITDCYILGFDDWLPTPNGNNTGENTFWSGYHEHYNFYEENNPIPTSGTVKMYSQRRYIQSILWAQRTFPLDTQRTYVVGVSNGGIGAYLTANLIPHKITAAYCVVPAFKLVTIDNSDDQPEQMWGDTASNLHTDILHPETGQPIRVFDLFDIRHMVRVNRNQKMPLMYSVFGKQDQTIVWSPIVTSFFDSLQRNAVGGISFWDQRKHNGNGKNFLDSETMPPWYSLVNNRPHPAFSNCSINQNPGNGNPANGDPYGAINGYLDWTRDSVFDGLCELRFQLFIRDFYVGGVLAPNQYHTCTADVTVRRAQNFKPQPGQLIKWKTFDANNTQIQSGSFVYLGGPLTIPGVMIHKSKSRLTISIDGCLRQAEQHPASEEAQRLRLEVRYHLGELYACLSTPSAESGVLTVVDMKGVRRWQYVVSSASEQHCIRLPLLPPGNYVLLYTSNTGRVSKSVSFIY
ncbi:MAG: hypothetical protein NZL95_04390 [Chitinophagales bacterium]|nr:hypothetical protein [Chitinophagales bacterium]MDW8427770.1 hypothetical protein [Chitinophagales bacterium]